MIIKGKDLSTSIKEALKVRVEVLKTQYGRTPNLVVVLVGEDPGSVSYVTGKAKAATEVGIANNTIRLADTIAEADLLALVDQLNNDDSVDGILVQLPLPKHIDENKVIAAISPEKDVDAFHPMNVAKLWLKQPCVLPCTPKGIIKLLHFAGVDIAGKEAVVVGRSNIVGQPVAKLLLDANATVTVAHSKTKNLAEVTRRADILVAAVGRERFITADMIKPGAVVIDVGVNRDTRNGKLCGDVDFEEAQNVAAAITPVPGGVGPMTIACLMENTVEAFVNRMTK
jgi:methylenetetrahydrofolate dehydrogenase (NADP+)/methenyltetrahydrofolate cyclohydrolase